MRSEYGPRDGASAAELGQRSYTRLPAPFAACIVSCAHLEQDMEQRGHRVRETLGEVAGSSQHGSGLLRRVRSEAAAAEAA